MNKAARLQVLEARLGLSAADPVRVIYLCDLRAPDAPPFDAFAGPVRTVTVDGTMHDTLPSESGRAAVERILAAMPKRPPVALAIHGEPLEPSTKRRADGHLAA